MFKRIVGCIFVCVLISGLAHAQDAASPIVKNGSFENKAAYWWGPAFNAKHAEIVPAASSDGKAALKLTGQWVCQDKMQVDSGANYKVAMKIKSQDASDGSVYVQMSFRGPGVNEGWYGPLQASISGRTEKAVIVTGKTHDWQDFSCVLPAPLGANQMLIYLRRTDSSGNVWIDDVNIQKTTETLTQTVKVKHEGPIVYNGGFENGHAAWWGPGLDSGKAKVVSDKPAEGKQCMQMQSGWIAQDKRPVEGGYVYKCTVKVRCADTDAKTVYVQASFRGTGVDGKWRGSDRVQVGNHQEEALFSTGGTHDWKTLTTELAAPFGADQIVLYLRRSNASGTAWFDEMSIESTGKKVKTEAEKRYDELASQWMPKSIDESQSKAAIKSILSGVAKNKVDELLLAADTKPGYAVHVAATPKLVSLYAGIELADYLGRISGATFGPLSSDACPTTDRPLIVVGRENALVKTLCPDIDYDSLGRDGFVIRTVGQHLVITGATPRGTLYGVYWFLDRHLGVRWYGPKYTYIPSVSALRIKPINEKQTPRFVFREVFTREAHDDRYAAHNLLNGRSHGRSYYPGPLEISDWEEWWHAKGGYANFFDLLPGQQKTHPEWFAGGQVAMMNKDMRQFMAGQIIKRLRALPDYRDRAFNIHDMDWGWDMDTQSKAFADQHGGVPSAPRLDMVIDIADQVRKVLPEARFTFNAYHWSFTPPDGMTIPSYITVFPMDIHVDYSQPIYEGPNEQLGKDVLKWCQISEGEMLYWNHTVNFFGFFQPTPILYPIGQSIQWLAKQPKITGYFCEDSHFTMAAEFAVLRTWMISRLLWDPTLDYRQLINEFVNGYYGEAGPYLQQYIDLMHETMAKTDGTLREKMTVDAPYLTFDFLRQADALFAKAHDAVADKPDFLAHVQTTRMSVDLTILSRRFDYMQEAKQRGMAWDPDTENRKARLLAQWDANKASQYQQGSYKKDLIRLLAIERKPAARPEMVNGLPDSDWVEYSDQTINLYGAKIVEDEKASDGAALYFSPGLGGWNAQFRRYKLPKEGKWDVYAAVRIDRGKAEDEKTALKMGISPPMGRFDSIKVSDISDGEYHWLKFPGSPMTYQQNDKHLLYFQPSSKVTEGVYVDRIVAVRRR